MEKKFKVGDRVECVIGGGYVKKGEIGTVVDVGKERINVRFDNYSSRRDGDGYSHRLMNYFFKKIGVPIKHTIGKALKNYGTTKAYRNEVMTHLENATFHQDDKLTFLKTDKGTGYALRNHEDANDADKGIYLAVTRIFGETKPRWQVEVDECIGKKEHFYINPSTLEKSIEAQKYLFACGMNWKYGEKNSIREQIISIGTSRINGKVYPYIWINATSGKKINM